MTTNIIWLNEFCLRASHPAMRENNDAHCCYIWDDRYLRNAGYGKKRATFMYQACTELPCTIYHGDTIETLKALVEEHNAEKIITGFSVHPDMRQLQQNIQQLYTLDIVRDDPFALPRSHHDLKRFFNYWKKAKASAMQQNAGHSGKAR